MLPVRLFLSAILCAGISLAQAQHTKYWTGGSGAWSDASHWSLAPNGTGGAGEPTAREAAVVDVQSTAVIDIDADARCASLTAGAASGELRFGGDVHELSVAGDLRLGRGVVWSFTGELVLKPRGNSVFDARNILMSGDVIIDAEGTIDLQSVLWLNNGSLVLRKGTLRTNDKALLLGGLLANGRASKRLEAGGSIVQTGMFDPRGFSSAVDPGSSSLLVSGSPKRWNGEDIGMEEFMRGITTCGTGAGQTQFVVNAQTTSDYNGWAVSCTGACDGAVTVTITGGVGPNFQVNWGGGGPTGVWNVNGPPGPRNWDPVCSGNKLVTVIDLGQGVGCFATVQVQEPPPLGVIFFGLNPPTCADVCNGTAITFPGGGVGFNYDYDWNSGTESTSNPSQLCAGLNTLELSDPNGCVFDTSFTINLQPLAVQLTSVNASCSGDCDGTASVVASGGTPDYDYFWEPGSPAGDGTPDVTGLCAGAYTVRVADANGCDTTIAFTITAPPPILPNLTFTAATCSDLCNGAAIAVPSGGSGQYSFDWGPGTITGDGTSNASALCAGNYTVLITDIISGCDTLVPFTITAPPPFDVQLSLTNATCAGDCDGQADVIISGGTPDYDLVWGPGIIVGQGTPNVTQLCAGDYTLTITDAVGCDTVLTFTITEPPPILPDEQITPITCANVCNGAITVAAGFSYTWSHDAGNNSNIASGLCDGSYSVTLSDGVCDTTITVVLLDPPPIIITPSHTDVTCGNACDGTASATVVGGNDPYEYAWAPPPGDGQGTPNATEMCAGAYTLTVTDSVGCEATQLYTILPPVPLQVTASITNATCPGVCDGAANVTVVGGNDPYLFNWVPAPGTGQGSGNVTGLCAQDYALTVIDSVGCDTTIIITITAPVAIDPNEVLAPPSCFNTCDGSIVLNPTGGNGTFSIVWTPTVFPGNTQALNLCAGTWDATITSGACDTTVTMALIAPPAVQAALTTIPTDCQGGCTGTATVSASGGTGQLTYTWVPPVAPPDQSTATDLCAGAYSVTVADAQGCDTLIAFTITAPTPIIPAITTTPADCGGACNGTATVSWTGGNGNVSVIWDPAVAPPNATNAVDLCPGIYSVTFTDDLACDTTIQFLINTPSGIQAVPTVTPASCGDVCDGTITLAITGGVPGYTVAWSPPPGSGGGQNVFDLCPGTYTAQITDQASCDTILVMVIDAPSLIIPNGTFTNETCNGPCDGTASVAPTGGSGGYSFQWAPPPPVNDGNGNVSGLCAGDWCVTITDLSGCDTTWCFTVLPEQPIIATLTSTDATCFGTCDGTAQVQVGGGTPDYSFVWNPQPGQGQGNDSVSVLCLGQYDVTITDLNGCDTSLVFFIDKPSPITTSLAFGAASCADPCSGDAAAFPSGGNGGYEFLWQPEPATGQGEFFVTGLCADSTYSLTITDSLGCDTTELFTIPPFTPLTVAFTTSPETCAGACDGTATLAVNGGEGPYSFDWPNGDTTATVAGLCPGAYDVTIADANGCDTVVNVLITGPFPIVLFPIVTDIRCHGENNGSIVVNSNGGTGPFTYNWTPQPPQGQGTAFIQQLSAGDWTVTIADSLGCDTTVTFTIIEPPVFTVGVSVTPSLCQSCIGVIALDPDGAGPFLFNWGAPIFQSTADSVQTGLCAGLYPVIAIDDFGCAIQLDVPVSDSDGELLTTTDDNVTCPTDCDGTVSVAYNCGVDPCSVEWYDPSGFPLFINTDVVTDLCAGIYFVQVTNGDGCISVDTAQVFAPDPMELQIGTTPVSCAGLCDGTAAFSISGGIVPYNITWSPDPGTGQGTTAVTGLCAGVYTVTVVDNSGCTITANVLILGPDPIQSNTVVNPITCAAACDGSIDLNAFGGTGLLIYTWNPVPPNGQGTDIATTLCAGTWGVTISDDNGCDTTLSFILVDPAPISLTVTTSPSSCSVCNGTADVSSVGGSGNVVVTWMDQANTVIGTGNSISGLCAGLYTATAVDDNGCTTSALAVVSDATGEVLTINNGQTLCANDCDAQVSVSFNCVNGPCEIFWYDAGGQLLAANEFGLQDLCVGQYLVQVDNGIGCSVIDTAFVTPSQILIPNLSTTPVSCSAACDGTATVGPQGGSGSFQYDWEPGAPTGDGTSSVTGLCAGLYTVNIQDASGCDTLVNVLITEPAPFTVSADIGDVSCNGQCDGTIDLLITGGSGALLLAWSPQPGAGQGTTSVSQLCPDTYTVLIVDANGCDTSLTFTVGEPGPLTLSTSSTLSTCSICTGTADVEASGGSGPYNYAWTLDNALYSTDSSITSLCAGLYIVTVTDAHACAAQEAVPVSDADGEVLTTTNDIVTCPGECDGEVEVQFQCSVPSCSIVWTDALDVDLGVSSNVISDLCEGMYFVQVTNGDGCLTIDTAIVTSPTPILPNLSTTITSCPDVCDGSATVGPTGGVAPYTFDWEIDPIVGDSTPTASQLCPGFYGVFITDSVGCQVFVDVLIDAPPALTANAVITPITCNAACDATITLTTQGGTGQPAFDWSPGNPLGDGTFAVTGLCADTWSVVITDVNQCDTTYTFLIEDPEPLDVDLSVLDNACFGDCAGSAIAAIAGGRPPYSILWTTGDGTFIAQDVAAINDRCAGDHILTVTDSSGCQVVLPFTIGQGVAFNAALTFIGETCNGPCDGVAQVAPSGGAGDLTVTWSDGNGQVFATDTNAVSGLCAGNYLVNIADTAGCDSTFAFTILPYTDISVTAAVSNVRCNGSCDGSIVLTASGGAGTLTYDWEPPPPNGDGTNSATNLCPDVYTVTVEDGVGCDTVLTFTITEPAPLTAVIDQVIEASCNTAPDAAVNATVSGGTPDIEIAWTGPGGFFAATEDIAGILPGSYILSVQDDNGCTVQQNVTVGSLSTVVADAGADITICAGESAALDGSASVGAALYEWTAEQGGVVGTTSTVVIDGLPAGTHTFLLSITDGPCTDSDTIIVNVLAPPFADAGPDHSIFIEGQVVIGGQPAGPGGSTFEWQPDSLLSNAGIANPVASPMETTLFVLTVTSPNGCASADSVLITVIPEIIIPSGFTPTGDGANDVWQIDAIEQFPECTVEIYNRWGELLFASVGYNVPWDGTYDGAPVPVGTYYYAIELNDERFPEPYTGPLTVIR